MASRIRNPFKVAPRHRAQTRVVTHGHPLDFRPRQCAGEGTNDGCLHNHPGEPALPTWPRTAS